MKFAALMPANRLVGRTPHGVRGLKLKYKGKKYKDEEVAPHTGCVD